MKYNKITILAFSFIFLFTLNNINNPTPAPTSSPESIVASVITFPKYNCVNITDEAQFGINPTNPAIVGPSSQLLSIKLDKASSPTICITVFNIKVIISMYTNILIECFKEDFNMLPSSQWQCSCSHISPILSSSCDLFLEVKRITKSIIKPAIIPIISLIPNIFNIILIGTASDINRGDVNGGPYTYLIPDWFTILINILNRNQEQIFINEIILSFINSVSS